MITHINCLKAFAIDSEKEEVHEVMLPENDELRLAMAQECVGGLIETAYELDNNDTFYCNEEGMFLNYQKAFEVKGAHQPFLGNGIVMGFNPRTGETVGAKSTIEEIQQLVSFTTLRELKLRYARAQNDG
jgi:hypothetical protein